MSLLDTKIELAAVKFNIDLELFPPIEGTTLYFLQEDGTDANYSRVDNRDGMTAGWRFTTNKYQQTKEMQVATTESGFQNVIAKSSHISIGSSVYEIVDGSLTPPTKDYPYYSFEVKFSGETFEEP